MNVTDVLLNPLQISGDYLGEIERTILGETNTHSATDRRQLCRLLFARARSLGSQRLSEDDKWISFGHRVAQTEVQLMSSILRWLLCHTGPAQRDAASASHATLHHLQHTLLLLHACLVPLTAHSEGISIVKALGCRREVRSWLASVTSEPLPTTRWSPLLATAVVKVTQRLAVLAARTSTKRACLALLTGALWAPTVATRWSAAKGVGRLLADAASEPAWVEAATVSLVRSIRASLPNPGVGSVQALGEIVRRVIPSLVPLDDVLAVLAAALAAEEATGGTATGGEEARDAAAFATWLAARRHRPPTTATSACADVLAALLVRACMDGVVRLRRACASAAQELLGRWSAAPFGLSPTVADELARHLSLDQVSLARTAALDAFPALCRSLAPRDDSPGCSRLRTSFVLLSLQRGTSHPNEVERRRTAVALGLAVADDPSLLEAGNAGDPAQSHEQPAPSMTARQLLLRRATEPSGWGTCVSEEGSTVRHGAALALDQAMRGVPALALALTHDEETALVRTINHLVGLPTMVDGDTDCLALASLLTVVALGAPAAIEWDVSVAARLACLPASRHSALLAAHLPATMSRALAREVHTCLTSSTPTTASLLWLPHLAATPPICDALSQLLLDLAGRLPAIERDVDLAGQALLGLAAAATRHLPTPDYGGAAVLDGDGVHCRDALPGLLSTLAAADDNECTTDVPAPLLRTTLRAAGNRAVDRRGDAGALLRAQAATACALLGLGTRLTPPQLTAVHAALARLALEPAPRPRAAALDALAHLGLPNPLDGLGCPAATHPSIVSASLQGLLLSLGSHDDERARSLLSTVRWTSQLATGATRLVTAALASRPSPARDVALRAASRILPRWLSASETRECGEQLAEALLTHPVDDGDTAHGVAGRAAALALVEATSPVSTRLTHVALSFVLGRAGAASPAPLVRSALVDDLYTALLVTEVVPAPLATSISDVLAKFSWSDPPSAEREAELQSVQKAVQDMEK